MGEQLATWGETKATLTKPASQRRPTRRLTAEDIGSMLRYRADGLSQAAIAQRLGCDQAAVNRWLMKLTDTTDTAKSYLRGSALRMAENIVKKGLPRDHIAALKGLSVLEEERTAGLVIQIGIKDSDVAITLSPSEGGTIERRSQETGLIQAGSDKRSSVNQPTDLQVNTLQASIDYGKGPA